MPNQIPNNQGGKKKGGVRGPTAGEAAAPKNEKINGDGNLNCTNLKKALTKNLSNDRT